MNAALAVNANNEAMLLFDGTLDFVPEWVECSTDRLGIRIVGDGGEQIQVGLLQNGRDRLGAIGTVCLVCLEGVQAIASFDIPLITQIY